MNRRLGWLASLVFLAACSGGAETPPVPTTEAPSAPTTEVPTTPTATTVTSSIVTRAPSAATGCPATDVAAAAWPGTVHSSSVEGNETLDLAGSPHRFPDGLNVAATLTIEPCTLVLVGTGQAIWINGNGTLVATGDAEHPIKLDSIDPEATRGSWSGVYFNDSATPRSRLAWVTIEDAGGTAGFDQRGAIYATGDYPVAMNEITIRRSGGHGISFRGTTRFAPGSAGLHFEDSGNADMPAGLVALADSNRVASLPTLTQTGCDAPEIVLTGETATTVTTTQTWANPGAGIRYHLRTDLTVEGPSGPVLTIAPGTTLALDGEAAIYVGWAADGGLVVDGQNDATRVTITSGRSTQSPGDWDGVLFGEHALAAACRLAWVNIAFAGHDAGWGNPHGCNQTGADHFAIQMREHPIAALSHVTVTGLPESTAAIQRGFVSDTPIDFTDAALGNDLAAGNCAQSFAEPTTGCPDPVPPCAR